jgi:23S rRNA (adenine2503-C2)-methyltransferase
MPINEHNNLDILMDSLKYFYNKTAGKITYEYILFHQFNDNVTDAKNLIRLTQKNFPVKINIIEYNPVEGIDFVKSSERETNSFLSILAKHGVDVTLRRSRGKDIDAACGQLANKTTSSG